MYSMKLPEIAKRFVLENSINASVTYRSRSYLISDQSLSQQFQYPLYEQYLHEIMERGFRNHQDEAR